MIDVIVKLNTCYYESGYLVRDRNKIWHNFKNSSINIWNQYRFNGNYFNIMSNYNISNRIRKYITLFIYVNKSNFYTKNNGINYR